MSAKMRVFEAKTATFWLKIGQNQGFAVTDSSTEGKFKLLITLMLQAMDGSKNGLHSIGGWGYRQFRGLWRSERE